MSYDNTLLPFILIDCLSMLSKSSFSFLEQSMRSRCMLRSLCHNNHQHGKAQEKPTITVPENRGGSRQKRRFQSKDKRGADGDGEILEGGSSFLGMTILSDYPRTYR